jgi:hypothetical protein
MVERTLHGHLMGMIGAKCENYVHQNYSLQKGYKPLRKFEMKSFLARCMKFLNSARFELITSYIFFIAFPSCDTNLKKM